MAERESEETSRSMFGGWVEGPDGFMVLAKKPQSFITEEYKKFSEGQRARWDLIEFIKVKLQQRRHK